METKKLEKIKRKNPLKMYESKKKEGGEPETVIFLLK